MQLFRHPLIDIDLTRIVDVNGVAQRGSLRAHNLIFCPISYIGIFS